MVVSTDTTIECQGDNTGQVEFVIYSQVCTHMLCTELCTVNDTDDVRSLQYLNDVYRRLGVERVWFLIRKIVCFH